MLAGTLIAITPPPRVLILNSGSAAARSYVLAVEQADGQRLENGVLKAMIDFATWRIPFGGACCLLAGARTITGALVPMVGPVPTAVNFVSGDYDRLQGLKGTNNSGKTIGTGYTIDTARQNDHHIACPVSVLPVSAFRSLMGDGASNATSATGIHPLNPATNCRVHSALSGATVNLVGFMAATGLKGLSRNSSAEYVYTDGTTEATFTRASATPVGAEMTVFDFTGGANSSDAGISMYSVGPFIDMTAFRLMSNALDAGLTEALT